MLLVVVNSWTEHLTFVLKLCSANFDWHTFGIQSTKKTKIQYMYLHLLLYNYKYTKNIYIHVLLDKPYTERHSMIGSSCEAQLRILTRVLRSSLVQSRLWCMSATETISMESCVPSRLIRRSHRSSLLHRSCRLHLTNTSQTLTRWWRDGSRSRWDGDKMK